MVAHDAGKSSPVQLSSRIGDQLVAVLPREGEIRHTAVANVPKLPTTEPVDSGWHLSFDDKRVISIYLLFWV